MFRAIPLQTEATHSKLRKLAAFQKKADECSNWMLTRRVSGESASALQKRLLAEAKRKYGFNVQVICTIARAIGRTAGKSARATTVKFNVPRNCKTFRTEEFFFVELGLYPKYRVAIPVRKNREWDRFVGLLGTGWTCKTFGLTPDLGIVAYLSKRKVSVIPRMNALGIDINATGFAYTILTPGGDVLRQGYLGQHIWVKQSKFENRRALLLSLNARKKLKRMRLRQRNYVRTNVGQMVAEIIKLANVYDIDAVAIERLSRFRPKGKTFNKKVMRIPFFIFRRILEGRCFDSGIALSRVDPYHTSKWCTRCGAVGAGHAEGNYALFRCHACGQVANADRKASLAVAVKSLLERNRSPRDWFQISGGRVPVSGLLGASPKTRAQAAVPTLASEEGKASDSNRW